MAAAENQDSWLDLQRMREERMRFEVLSMLHRVAEGRTDREVNCWSFATELGVWHAEVFRVVEFLERQGLVRYLRAGPVVCLEQAGVDFLLSAAARRRSIRAPEE